VERREIVAEGKSQGGAPLYDALARTLGAGGRGMCLPLLQIVIVNSPSVFDFRSSGVDGVWGHDKYEEIVSMEDKTEPVQSSQ